MDLRPYVDSVRHELSVAAAAAGPEAQALADRLTAPLESAIRLALLESLSEAAEHITRDLAPASVDVRLRGRDPEFAFTPADSPSADDPPLADDRPAAEPADDGRTWRVTLRLPEHLRAGVESAARQDGQSVNAWLVRAVGSALRGADRSSRVAGKSFSGWVR